MSRASSGRRTRVSRDEKWLGRDAAERSLRRSLGVVAIAAGVALLAGIVSLVVVLDFVLPHLAPETWQSSGAAEAIRVLLLVDGLVFVVVTGVLLRERIQLIRLRSSLARERDQVRATGDDLAVQAEHMTIVLGVAERLAGVVSDRDMAAIVTPAVREITGADEAILWLVDEDGSLTRAGGDANGEGSSTLYLASSTGGGATSPPDGWAVSLVAAEDVVGVLEIRGRPKPPPAIAAIVEALAAHTAGAIEVNRRYASLREESHTDSLTSLPNRAALMVTLADEFDRARRTGHSLALVMVDVDHFKDYNDRHGHLEGDQALSSIARVLARGLRRRGDGAYRYGGEEFILVLPEADSAAGVAAAERLRLEVRHASERGSPSFPVTASFGVASLNSTHTAPAELLADADSALYRAKRLGRDRVEVAADPPGGAGHTRQAS